jgi:3-methyladenine DNA glycosylase/8-oxoguanine DNA glycosylase
VLVLTAREGLGAAPGAIDLRSTLGAHARGAGDPTVRLSPSDYWRAARTPDGPATLHVWLTASGRDAEVWGPGGNWLLVRLPELLGDHDDPTALIPRHAAVAFARRRHPGLRIGRTSEVLRAFVPAVLAQRVTSVEAARAWRGISWALGEKAPGPSGLLLPPAPADLAGRPYWWYHRFGVDRGRAETIRFAARHADRLEEAVVLPLAAAYGRLAAVPGAGPWTVATVAGTALGDPDAVVVGDYHLPHLVTSALAGRRRGTDDEMLELLEPYRGQRARVQRLLALSGLGPARRAPRQAILPMASW